MGFQDLSLIRDWFTTLTLVFGGCCSNAITLEQLTLEYPQSGTLITFCQFLLISLAGLPNRITLPPPQVRQGTLGLQALKQRKIAEHVAKHIADLKRRRKSDDHRPLWIALDGHGYVYEEPVDMVTRANFLKDLTTMLRAQPVFSGILQSSVTEVSAAEAYVFSISASDPMKSLLPKFQDCHYSYTDRTQGGVHPSQRIIDIQSEVDLDDSVILVETPSEMVTQGDLIGGWWDLRIFLYNRYPEPSTNARRLNPQNSSIIVDVSSTDAVHLTPGESPSFYTHSHDPESTSRWHFFSVSLPRFKPRRIPLAAYSIQVALFYLVSLLNNAAFRFRVPMSVHIIFRSGGLIVSMVLSWLVLGRKYSPLQIISVILVSLGVLLTTLSASQISHAHGTTPMLSLVTSEYATGIGILSLALVLSGFLGLTQDLTYARYNAQGRPVWTESMFYLHFLALPLFVFAREDLRVQLESVRSSPKIHIPLPDPSAFQLGSYVFSPSNKLPTALPIPVAYLSLLLNTVTQLVCVSGVHRLTSRVSSLTVTLVLVVRKAVSLLISVVLFQGGHGNAMMWTGAALVLIGTIGYSKKANPEKTKGHSNGDVEVTEYKKTKIE